MSANISYFLCANSCNGFYSLCDEITKNKDTKFIYIIKGGPGCGKSSFMKKVGKGIENLGHKVEYIYCSGDPASLDGIFVPALGVAYMDGTAPHILEPDYPGVTGRYINMGEYYDFDALHDMFSKASKLVADYKGYYAKAYKFLRAAGEVKNEASAPLFDQHVCDTISKRINGICTREIPDLGKEGKIKRRFLSAFTCEGKVFRSDTVNALCDRVCTIDNEFGFAPQMLDKLCELAVKAGYEVLLSPSPLFPDKIEYLLIPDLSLAFLSVSAASPYDGEFYKHIRLDALADKETYKDVKCTIRDEKKLYSSLLEAAQQNLFSAKGIHDELESLLNPNVDFDGVYALAEKHIALYK